MPGQVIQWFPGHMAKTRRLIAECLPDVDIVLELLDARIPASSRNPEIRRLLGEKPTLTLLNKCSLAHPGTTAAWVAAAQREGQVCLPIDCITGEGLSGIAGTIRGKLKEKISRYQAKGMEGRRLRAMVVGIPNVGKSSLINRLAGEKRTKVEDRPGVTMARQWISTSIGLSLLDMPGVLWPKFEDRLVGENLALTGAIRDQILDVEELAPVLCERLQAIAPGEFALRYKLAEADVRACSPAELFLAVGKKRGYVVRGGEIDTLRTAQMLLDEFRGGQVGRISLERPE
ncbi:MAG: ribosome biogenesis GTPase YlqF [Eubacteriales bacterium]